jgi:5-methylcytosine-specific restriction endonuclease McrA
MARLAHKPGRKSNYVHTLRSSGAYWEMVRRSVRIRDNHKCVLCKKQTELEVHHLTYYADGGSILGKEMQHLDKLVLLCSGCHQEVHEDLKHLLNPKNYAHTNHKAKFLEG